MAVRRQKSWLGQQRVDSVHLREIESAVTEDFDDLAGKVLASSQAIVIHGMNISMGAAVGNFATQLVLNTAGGILLHGTASEPGAVFVIPNIQPAETLNTANANIVGSFTPNSINYIGIDLIRQTDSTTTDIVKFRSATTGREFSQQVPLARTLQYRIIISVSDFALLTNVAPIAKVTLDANSVVQDVTDCRQMMFRLGSGGSAPDPLDVFSWPGGRTENPVTSTSTTDPFVGADKSISSFIDFFHAMESRLWEVGGGEHWYSQTTDRDVLFVRDPASLFVSNNENFEWTGTNLHWKGLSFDFGNSTAIKNTISNQLIDSPGLTDLAVGQCIYVDLNRAVDSSVLIAVKANLANIGTPAIPGSRHIIAWRVTEGVFGVGSVYPVGFPFAHATTLAYGVVKIYANAGTDAVVPSVDINGLVWARGLTRDTNGTLAIGGGIHDTEVDIAQTGVETHINGSLLVQSRIDTLSSGILVVGNTLATRVDIGNAAINTRVLGYLQVASDIDRTTAGTLAVGGVTATRVNISRTSMPTRTLGPLEVIGTTTFYADPSYSADPATDNVLARKYYVDRKSAQTPVIAAIAGGAVGGPVMGWTQIGLVTVGGVTSLAGPVKFSVESNGSNHGAIILYSTPAPTANIQVYWRIRKISGVIARGMLGQQLSVANFIEMHYPLSSISHTDWMAAGVTDNYFLETMTLSVNYLITVSFANFVAVKL